MKNISPFLFFLFTCCISIYGQNTNINIYPTHIKWHNEECDSTPAELKKTFKYSLISETKFNKIEDNSAQYIRGGDSNIRWGGDTLEIICGDTIISFEDVPEDEYGYYSTHVYRGQLMTKQPYSPFIIDVDYSEYSAILIIDNQTGEEFSLYSFPIISADGKYLIDFSSEPFNDEESWITIYKIDRNGLTLIVSLGYDSWLIPAAKYGGKSGKWDRNGTLYVPTLDMRNRRWNEDGTEDIKYLKLEIDMEKLR